MIECSSGKVHTFHSLGRADGRLDVAECLGVSSAVLGGQLGFRSHVNGSTGGAGDAPTTAAQGSAGAMLVASRRDTAAYPDVVVTPAVEGEVPSY
jgi:hypothetical protein